MAEATITDEMSASMQQKVGLTLRIGHSINNEDATRLAIAKFAGGIGDTNPLWTDEAYATHTRFGGIVAPPAWILCCFSGLQFGWPGLGSFHNATTIEFFKPVRLHDRIFPECIYDGFDGPKPSSFADQIVIDNFTNRYRNQRGEVVAHCK